MDRSPATRPPRQVEPAWWLWANVLSLDAPAVALVWQLLFARCLHSPLPPAAPLLLVAGAWCTYVLDRLLDARAHDADRQPGWRHAFYRHHQRVFWVLVLVAGFASAWFAWFALPAPLLQRGTLLSSLLVLYMGAVHLLPSGVGQWFPKEYAVGALFAAGVTLPFWRHIDPFAFLLFALVCQINTVAVEVWESGRLTLWLGQRIGSAAATLTLIAAAMTWMGGDLQGVFASIAASALLMCIIAFRRPQVGVVGSCALMDAALLTPVVLLLYQR